jgi:hypothetical protein
MPGGIFDRYKQYNGTDGNSAVDITDPTEVQLRFLM